ncbi:COG1470 family protein [Kitasatospora sp. NPDC004240]
MSIWTALEPASAPVEPGGATTVTLRVRNTGDVVEEYRITPLGEPAQWVSVEPATLTQYPGTTGTVELTFAPPRTPDATAGPQPFAVQVTPSEQREAVTVVEGVLLVAPFTELRAELVPPTSRGRFRGRMRYAVDNLGNTPVTAVLSGQDTGDQYDVEPYPSSVRIEPGRAVFGRVTVKPRQVRWSGGKETVPVTVSVRRQGAEPLDLEASHLSRAVLPGWAPAVLGLVAALTVGAIALWLTASPSVASRAKPLAAGSASMAAAAATIAPPPLAPAPSEPPPGAPPAEQPAVPGEQPNTGGGGSGGSGGGGGSGGSGGGGSSSGGGGGGGGGGAQPPAPAPGPAQPGAPAPAPRQGLLPIRAGDSNVFVAFAQERLKRLPDGNDCRLGKPVTYGLMDANTVEAVKCFQRATDRHNRVPAGNLLPSDKEGNLGRATMAALWMYEVIGDASRVGEGKNTWDQFSLRAAVRWAGQVEVNADDLSYDERYAREALNAWSKRTAMPTAAWDAKLADQVRKYQTEQPKAGGSMSVALNALISGWVKSPDNPGTVLAAAWPRP